MARGQLLVGKIFFLTKRPLRIQITRKSWLCRPICDESLSSRETRQNEATVTNHSVFSMIQPYSRPLITWQKLAARFFSSVEVGCGRKKKRVTLPPQIFFQTLSLHRIEAAKQTALVCPRPLSSFFLKVKLYSISFLLPAFLITIPNIT